MLYVWHQFPVPQRQFRNDVLDSSVRLESVLPVACRGDRDQSARDHQSTCASLLDKMCFFLREQLLEQTDWQRDISVCSLCWTDRNIDVDSLGHRHAGPQADWQRGRHTDTVVETHCWAYLEDLWVIPLPR